MGLLISFLSWLSVAVLVGAVIYKIDELGRRVTELEKQKKTIFGPDFFKKGEDVVMPGAPPGFYEPSDYSTGNEPRGIIFKVERPIVVQDKPDIPKMETTPPAPPKKTVSKKQPTKATPKPKAEKPK